MNRAQFAHRYSGNHAIPPPMGHHGPGTCRSCGQPSSQCCCGCRECRKESRELVVRSSVATAPNTNLHTVVAATMQQPQNFTGLHGANEPQAAAAGAPAASADKAIDTAFIG